MNPNQLFLIAMMFTLLGASEQCFGYIDPSTGASLAQAILAVVVSLMVSVRLFWTRIRLFFRKMLK